MKINGFIMANRAQEVPIPIPGTEITTGLTKSMGQLKISFEIPYENSSTYEPMPSVQPTKSTITLSAPDYVHYYDMTGITGNPLPVDFQRHWDGRYESRPNPAIAYRCELKNFIGSVTFGGLSAGKYVAVIEHYYGTRSTGTWGGTPPKPLCYAEVLGALNAKIIRGTEDGVCYGETTGATEEYICDIGYALGNGTIVKFIQKQSFVVAEGQTGKTITFGGDNFSLSQFCTVASGNLSTDGKKVLYGAFFSGTAAWRTRVYTDGGNA